MKGDPKMVKQLDKKIKKGKFFYFLVVVIAVLILLNILHLISVG